MANVKTAISLQESLFEQVKELAHDLRIPRSRVVVLALEDFIRRHENRDLLAQVNAAYKDSPEGTEQKRLRQMRRSHRRIVEGEW